jgi:hypothetical protein
MRTKVVLVLGIILFGLTALATAQESLSQVASENAIQLKPMNSDPGVPDTFRINDAAGTAGGKAVVETYFYNDEELSALTLPLSWSSSAITLDSVSWAGSRVAYLATRIATINNINHTVSIGAVVMFEDFIPAGQGLACKLYFNIPAGTPDQIVTIDTTTIGPAYYNFGLPSSEDFTPVLRVGKLIIGNPKPTIGFSPVNFNFNATEGGSNPANQTLNISNTGAGNLNWTLTKASGWLGLAPTSGTNAGTVTVSVNITGLTAATYKDTIVITDPNADNSPQKVPVTLVLAAPPKPTISLVPTAISFSATQGGSDPMAKALSITNVGQGTLNWSATKSTAWLGLNPTSGTGNGTVTVSVTLGALMAGTYVDTIVVSDPNATNSPQKSIVTLTVASPPKPTILLSPVSFTFNATEGGANPAVKVMAIINSGQGTLNWTATKSSTWLTLSKMSGTGNTADTLSVDITGLTGGTYVDTIVVSDPNATNSPQMAVVTLIVAAAPKPTIHLEPSAFTFDAIIDSINPPPQTLVITNIGEGTLNWTVSKTAAWLFLAPTSGSGDGSVIVSVDTTGLIAGTYRDTIVVTDPQASNSPQRVPVVLFVYEPMKPSIFLSPQAFTFNAVEGAGILDTQVLHISSVETGILNWTATNSADWLTLDPTSGVDDGLVTLTVDASGLTAGTYVDTIVVSDPNAANSPQKAVVTLNVSPAAKPMISVTPPVLEFTADEGGANPPAKSFVIANSGGGELHWTLEKQTSWLLPSPMFGTGNATVTVNVDIAGLTAGVYVDTIFVSDPSATNSPQYVAVGLSIEPAVGERDTVVVSDVTTYPGGKTVVDITYQNFAAIQGFSLPLHFVGSGVICDSVSWVGSRFEDMDVRIGEINNDEWTIAIVAISINAPVLEPGQGLLAKLYFSIDPSATPKVVPIDTGFFPPNNEFIFADDHGELRPTGFAKGSITITEEMPPCFAFPVDTINFVGTLGETIPSIILPVTNPCGGTLTWTATWDSTWLSVTPTDGTQDQMVKFQVNTDGLGVGSYLEIVKFESNGTNSPFYLKVRLSIAYLEHPQLAISDTLFDFGDVCWGDTVDGAFDIYNAGDGTLPWNASAMPPIELSAHSGVAPSHVLFHLPSGLLPMGPQSLTINVSSSADPEAIGTIMVKLNVIDCGGQCGFDIADVNGGIGRPVGVPIYAFNITDVAGLEFHIWYDTTVLQADSVTSAFMAGPTLGFADPMIHYVWDSLDGAFDVPNGAAIMTLWFTVVGDVGQTGAIEWMGESEVVNHLAQVLNVSYCPGSVTAVPPVHILTGKIVYYDLTKPVPDVNVEIQGPEQAATATDVAGKYRFEDLYSGDYQVFAFRFENDSGVTVADAVKMRRHLAQLEPFDSPYKMIAADVNVSNTVSIADVIVVRRYLAMLDTLPSGNWVFVDSGFTVTMNNWYNAPRDIRVTITDHDVLLEPFIGIRMGDVNNTWNSPKGMFAKPAGGEFVSVGIGEVTALEGETIAIPVTMANASDLAGLEIHVGYDPHVLTYAGVSSETFQNMTVNGGNGAVHVIWEDINAPRQLNGEQTAITMNFQVTGHLPASTEINLTGAEIVNSAGDPYRLAVSNGYLYNGNGGSSTVPNTYSLSQNSPNPFNPTTTIHASMAEAGEYTLTVFNIMGERVRQYRGWHAAGPLAITWDARNDNGVQLPSGIYLYRFQAGSFSQTKQMILLK